MVLSGFSFGLAGCCTKDRCADDYFFFVSVVCKSVSTCIWTKVNEAGQRLRSTCKTNNHEKLERRACLYHGSSESLHLAKQALQSSLKELIRTAAEHCSGFGAVKGSRFVM